MIFRCTVTDLHMVQDIFTHESVYPLISDDGSLSPEAFRETENLKTVLESKSIYVLAPNRYSITIFFPCNSNTFELHTMVLPEGRGKMAIKGAADAFEWMFLNTKCLKIITYVPTFNRAAKVMARMVGFVIEGCNRKSFLKGGVLYDQTLLGITKEDWICQQQAL